MTHEIAGLNVSRPARLAVALAAAALAGGCFSPGKLQSAASRPYVVDPNSPVARDVAYASKHPGPFPRFAEIPKVPTDIRPVSAWREAVDDLKSRKAELDQEAADLPPPLSDTEPYAAGARSRAAADPADVAPPDAPQQTESYAQSLRERATPPPTPK